MTATPQPSNLQTFAFTLGLIGYPLGHSLSPQIHATALQTLGLSGSYSLFPIASGPEGQAALQALLAQMRQGELHGLNVTIPHKQTIIPWLDQLTPTALAIGAVNTIYLQGDQLIGDNTDAPGFWADLVASLPLDPATPGRALILGAGGSARAVAYALLAHGWQLTLAARRLEQADELASSMVRVFPNLQPATCNLQQIARIDSPHLIINTTPLGMAPNVSASPWPDGLAFPAGAALYDLVYNPPRTRLVQQAQAAGLAVVSGLGLLVEQAALAFECWTGRAARRAAMHAVVHAVVHAAVKQ